MCRADLRRAASPTHQPPLLLAARLELKFRRWTLLRQGEASGQQCGDEAEGWQGIHELPGSSRVNLRRGRFGFSIEEFNLKAHAPSISW